MLCSEEVLAACAAPQGTSGESLAVQPTPGALDCAARLKRQRLDTDGSDASGCVTASAASAQQHWALQQQQQQCDTACLTLPLAHRAAATDASAPVAAAPAACLAQLAAAAHAVPWQASFLLDYVHRCLDALSAMHPVCTFIRPGTKAADLACAIFRSAYLARSPTERATLMHERFLVQALLAASLWIAIKFEATRTTTPDARIMSRITGIPAGLLVRQERDTLAALQWDLMPLARQVGAVGCVDLSDSPALEQQLQLATLTQHAQLAALAQRVQHAQQAQKQALQGMPWALPSSPTPAQHEAYERPSFQLAVLLAQSAACRAQPGNLLPQPSSC